ncbi:MAG TPA: DNA repair protein RadA [Patescibacteria group bacterium]|nr:DNA repair protein RadA [Patescibacteria group bacterium]
MPKTNLKFVCNNCGAEFLRWQGKCSACNEWETLEEIKISSRVQSSKLKVQSGGVAAQLISLDKVDSKNFERIKTNISEFDRVLGGGIVLGSLVLLGGDPGIGKSTLLLQSLVGISQNKSLTKILYVSGEESAQQIKLRAERLKIKNEKIFLLAESDLESILATIEMEKPNLVIIDSIQTVYSDQIASASGSIVQVKNATESLMRVAKATNVPIFIIGHVTKDGGIAGPKTLEHLVDVVLYLEGDRYQSFRILRGIKNRFGKTSEVGIFEMEENGMTEVANPSKVFLEERLEGASGVAVSSIIEGNRPFLVEIQALCSKSYFGYPKRTSSGIDLNRLNLLIAIIEKRVGVDMSQFDCYLNVVGGIRIRENSVDLAAALSIISAAKNKPIDDHTAIFGELGLSGEIRSIPNLEKRIEEAIRMGFDKIVIPKQNSQSKLKPVGKVKFIEVRTLKESMGRV